MVICKFFLQGNCRFGDYCKFEHQFNENFSSIQNKSSASILRQPNFGPPQLAKPPDPVSSSPVDTNTLIKSVVNDMTVTEKGGQWLLSCYGPYKEQPSFPGFEDQSFEEIRFGYYEAKKNGTLEQYKQQVQMILQQAMLKLKSLQSPSPDIINLLKSFYTPPQLSQPGVFGDNSVSTNIAFNTAANTTGQQPLPTFNQQPSSIFAQANQGLFANKPPESNIFGVPQNANIFGGQTVSAPFGSSQHQPQAPNKSLFGQANVNPASGGSIFGGSGSSSVPGTNAMVGSNIFQNAQPNSNPVFARQQTNMSLGHAVHQNTPSPFVPQPHVQADSSNIFGKQPTNIFAAQNPAGPFSQPAQPQTNIFGPSVVQNVPQTFANTTRTPIFDQQNMFTQQNQQQISNSPFANQAKTILEVPQSNIFGNSQMTMNPNLARSQAQPVDETIYSKLEDLTDEEIKWFENDDLDILNIPEKPPTYQMCFKT